MASDRNFLIIFVKHLDGPADVFSEQMFESENHLLRPFIIQIIVEWMGSNLAVVRCLRLLAEGQI